MRKYLLFILSLCSSVLAFSQVSESERSLSVSLVQNNAAAIGLQQDDISNSIVTNTYITPGTDIRMVYLQQSYRNILVYNQLHVLAFRNGKAVSVAGSRIASASEKVNVASGVPGIDPVSAVKTALAELNSPTNDVIVPSSISRNGQKFEFGHLGVSSENIFAELLWYPVNDEKELKLVWQIFAAPLNNAEYWFVRVDALDNTIINRESLTNSCDWSHSESEELKNCGDHKVSNTNWVTKREEKKPELYSPVVNTATYRVIKYPAESPQHTNGAPALVTDPWTMSPGNATTYGWHFDGTTYFDSLRGNNAFAYEDRDANNQPGYSALTQTPQPSLTFDYIPDFTMDPRLRTPPNQQFNTVNLFYWNNLLHDLSYLYGFTETVRNYQANNLGRGGVGNDYVLAEAQDGSGTNNANFSSGVEGTRGRMQMYLWTAPNPDRDGDVDNGIVAHEYTHGISNRMTGTGAGCLNTVEQMGEGWSDYMGLMITHDWSTAVPTDGFNNPRGIGTYALNQPVTGPGIRQYRYTTNMAVNPMTYGNLPSVAVPHGVGTIWCTALWDMTWYIIQQAGISPNLFNPTATGGNVIALKLVMEGLRLQPCGPGFITGRNAILKADTLLYGAQYSCAIIEAFARRGMGIGASQGSATVRGDEILSFVNGKAVITQQPASASTCVGANQSFTVAATGANLRYQWELSTNGGGVWNPIPGETNATYTITGVTLAMNTYQYRCIVTGCPPAVTSSVATLTVSTAPSINTQPNDVTVCEPNTASFTVTAIGTGLLYQWQVSINNGASYQNISGATNATLNLGAVTAAMNNNLYQCIVSSAGCSTSATSNPARLFVNTAPNSVSQPQSATLCTGSNNTFSVSASGTNLTYQWQLSTDGGGTWNPIPGANSSSYTVTNITSGMNNSRYRCVIGGTCAPSVTSSEAVLTAISPVSISNQPANRENCSGDNATFTVSVSSVQTVSYQWQVLPNGGGNWTDIPGANSASYTINAVTTLLNGNQYRVSLTNISCSTPVLSNAAVLTVRQLPTVTLSASPLTSLLPGQLTVLTANPIGTTGTLSTIWYLNGNVVANVGNTRTVNVEQIGSYRVTVQETFAGGLVCSSQSQDLVIDAKESKKLFIFPSPNDGRFNVAYYNTGGASTQRKIVIMSTNGQKVYEQMFPIAGPYTLLNIDMRNAARGIYVVLVGDVNGNRLAIGKVHVR